MSNNVTTQQSPPSDPIAAARKTTRTTRLAIMGLTVLVLGSFFALRNSGIISESSQGFVLIVFIPPAIYFVVAWLKSRQKDNDSQETRRLIQQGLFTLVLAAIALLSLNWAAFDYVVIAIFGVSILLLIPAFSNQKH